MGRMAPVHKYNTMRIDDILAIRGLEANDLSLIQSQCEQFFEEAGNTPLYKNLPSTYDDLHKVKVRQRKAKDTLDHQTFNAAFESQHHKLRERAIFAHGISSLVEATEYDEPFFVLPIDGFQYVYSPEIKNSDNNYKQVIEMFYENFGQAEGTKLAVDMIRFSYLHEKLQSGIKNGSEIIVYNIPYYYAARADAFESYDDFLHLVQSIW